ncbi:hypothetical protein ACFSTE_02630 [Aquimarina hainanensis]|uniref:Uncharacterized protein n=1 Tax=Aquimarina hainanensis TaxID=1578017 RepID=A0ABW5N3P3_9FLAO
MSKQNPSEKYHHGKILKDYILENRLNRKGGINRLAKALRMTRQGIYSLYKQKEIKIYNRRTITDYYNLPEDFFPDPDQQLDEFNELFRDYINASIKIQRLEDDLGKAQMRYLTRSFMDALVFNPDNIERNNVYVLTGDYADIYLDNYFKVSYLDSLSRMNVADVFRGYAFEVEREQDTVDFGCTERRNLALCTHLVEFYENIEEDIPYIVVFRKASGIGTVLCKYVSYFRRRFRLYSPNKSVKDIELIQEEVFQIWEVERFLDLDKKQYDVFLKESAKMHDFL